MKAQLIKILLDQTFIYDFYIKEILNKFFPKEKPEFYIDLISSENNFLQKLYLIKDIFHKQLKYYNKIFHINHKHIKFDIPDYFYLNSLISDEPDLINCDYDLIISIDRKNESLENSLKKAMTSKIIIDLINNFKNAKDYNKQKKEKELNEIEKKNKGIIEENIKEFKINLNIDDIICMKIDVIYIKIIESIIMSNNFEDIENIFLQLGLDAINIANIKFKELEIITKKEKYMISEIKDLFDNEKINYYYILVKYIFKAYSNINNINLLKNFQQFLIKIIKSQLSELSFNYIDNETIYEKRNYVIKFILNNEYYYQKYSESFKLIELINYYKKYSNESNKEEIKSIEMMLKSNKINKTYEIKYLNFQIIKNLFKKLKFKDLKETTQVWIDIKKQIIKKSLNELEKYNDLLIKCLRDEYIKEIFIKIFPKDIFDYFNKEISNIKTFVNNQNSNINNKGIQSSDDNNENNENPNRDNNINEIRNLQEYSKNGLQINDYERFCTFLFPPLQKNEKNKEIFSYYITKRKNNFDETIELASNNFKFEGKIITKIKNWIEKKDELNNLIKNSKIFFKALNDMKQSFSKKLNDKFEIDLEFKFKREMDLPYEPFYNISYECYYITITREFMIANSNVFNNGMNIESIISKINTFRNSEIQEESPFISFNLKSIRENNNFEDINVLNNSFNLNINIRMQIDGKLYVILTQEGDLIIHWETGRIFKIVGCSIEISNNEICIIQKSNENNDRVLICCCKNQIKEKNGILLVELDKKETETFFLNIPDFQVEHMCLLNMSDYITRSKSKNNNWVNNNPNNIYFSKKYYFFLIGGYDIRENKPKVKLYQVLTDENNNEKNDQMSKDNIKGIKLKEIPDETLSKLEFKSNIISISQDENGIAILTKENTYYLSFNIYGN